LSTLNLVSFEFVSSFFPRQDSASVLPFRALNQGRFLHTWLVARAVVESEWVGCWVDERGGGPRSMQLVVRVGACDSLPKRVDAYE